MRRRSGNRVRSVIRASHQRSAFDVSETHLIASPLQFREFIHRHIANDRQVLRRGPQMLARKSCLTASTSSMVSPRPSINPDLVGVAGLTRFTWANMSSERSYRAPRRTCRYNLGTVSVL